MSLLSFNNTALKKIVNVYQLTYKNGVAQGFGDYLRGCICLLQIANKLGIQFDMDIQNHPMSKFLTAPKSLGPVSYEQVMRYEPTNYFALSQTTFKVDNEFFLPDFVKHLNLIKGSCYFLFCNSFPISPSITQEEKDIIKSKITPNDKMKRQIEETFMRFQLKKQQYTIIHLRCGDEYLLENKQLDLVKVEKIVALLCPIIINSTNKIVLLSDNNKIKQVLKVRFPRVISHLAPIVHLGESAVKSDKAIMYTLIDFYIMSFSKNILACSPYTWGSGFSEWCSVLYNIPYKKMIL